MRHKRIRTDADSYHALSKKDYEKLIFESPLNQGLKSIFKPIDTVAEYEILQQCVFDAREEILRMAKKVSDAAMNYPLNNMPLRFILDNGNSSGGKFLRWRNPANDRSGQFAWEEYIQDKNMDLAVREALLAIEKDRIVFNMQMSILNFILRQTRDCKEKLKIVEALFDKGDSELSE